MTKRSCIFVFILFSIALNLFSEELIILAVDDNLNIYNKEGALIQARKLKFKLGKNILIKDNYVVYDTPGHFIAIENLVNNVVTKFKFNKIVFKDEKYYGQEVYFDCDYDSKKRQLIFCVRPESVQETDAEGGKVHSFDELHDITKIYLYNINTKEFKNIDNEGYCSNPRFIMNKIIYEAGNDIVVKDNYSSKGYFILKEIKKQDLMKEVELLTYITTINKDLILGGRYRDQEKESYFIFKYDLNQKKIKGHIFKNPKRLLDYNFLGKKIIAINGCFNNMIVADFEYRVITDFKIKKICLLDLKNFKEIFIGYNVAKGTRFINSNEILEWENVINIGDHK